MKCRKVSVLDGMPREFELQNHEVWYGVGAAMVVRG